MSAKAENERQFPPMEGCGPEGCVCHIDYAHLPQIMSHRSCPNHASACAAGPWLVHADNQFRARVLKVLGKYKHCPDVVHAVDAIRNLDTGHMRDAVREGKGK